MQACLITTYKNQKQLVKLIKSLNEHAYCYVHVDKKSKEIDVKALKKMGLKNTYVYSKYRVGWGTYTHLLAIIFLIKEALKNPKIHFIHTISSQDIRIKKWDEIEKRFENNEHIYMSFFDARNIPAKTRERYTKRIVTSRGTTRKYIGPMVEKLNKFYRNYQDKHNIEYDDISPFTEIYKGMIWCSMPRAAAQYAMKYTERKSDFMKSLSHVTLPEEFFFQTIFWNSEYRDKIVKNNLRFTVWKRRHGSRPAILDKRDIDDIRSSECIFARKIDAKISKKLVKLIDEYIGDE